jgi:hypothetical protein
MPCRKMPLAAKRHAYCPTSKTIMPVSSHEQGWWRCQPERYGREQTHD